MLSVWHHIKIRGSECLLTEARIYGYLENTGKAKFSIFPKKLPNSNFSEGYNQFSQKALGRFFKIHIFLILEMCSLKPTISHCLWIVTKFWPLPAQCVLSYESNWMYTSLRECLTQLKPPESKHPSHNEWRKDLSFALVWSNTGIFCASITCGLDNPNELRSRWTNLRRIFVVRMKDL